MQIGELSRKSGFSRDTIRFYEKKGLIRTEGMRRNKYQYKDYTEQVLKRLQAIRQIKDYGFTLQETFMMMVLFEEGVLDPERGKRYLQRKIAVLDQKIQELVRIRSGLQEIVEGGLCGKCPLDKLLREAAIR
jgi:DNA-binding transcriptional MerR regulator